MPYLHCPTCRLTVSTATAECPRCGGALEPRILAAALDPRAVRAALVKRGGRFQRSASPTGRFRPAERPNRAG